jgi:hypothetical protein
VNTFIAGIAVDPGPSSSFAFARHVPSLPGSRPGHVCVASFTLLSQSFNSCGQLRSPWAAQLLAPKRAQVFDIGSLHILAHTLARSGESSSLRIGSRPSTLHVSAIRLLPGTDDRPDSC